MRPLLLSLSAIALIVGSIAGCPSSPDPGDAAPTWDYVSGVLATNCSPCHTSGAGFPSADPMNGLGEADTAYDQIVDHPAAEAPGLDRIEPGDSANSYLIHKLRGTHVDAGGSGDRMPDGGPFFEDEVIDAIAEWVDAGALQNGGDDDDAADDDDAVDDDDAADDDDSASGTSFSSVYSTIIESGCSCHAGASHSTGFAFNGDEQTAYDVLVDVPSAQAAGLDRIEPGSPVDSYLWNKVNGTQNSVGGSGGQMPLAGCCLDQTQLDTLETWINDGALR